MRCGKGGGVENVMALGCGCFSEKSPVLIISDLLEIGSEKEKCDVAVVMLQAFFRAQLAEPVHFLFKAPKHFFLASRLFPSNLAAHLRRRLRSMHLLEKTYAYCSRTWHVSTRRYGMKFFRYWAKRRQTPAVPRCESGQG